MHTTADCKINGLQLTELKYENLIGTPVLSITYALTQVHPKTLKLIHTHGKVTATGANLSRPTLDLFGKAIAAMEEDLAARHFSVTPTTEEKVTKEKENVETGIATSESEEDGQF